MPWHRTRMAQLALALAAAGLLVGQGAQAQTAAATPSNTERTTPTSATPAAAASASSASSASPTSAASSPLSSGTAPGAAEPPAAPCESEDADIANGDPNGGLASESFAAQRIRQKPTPATRIACALKRGRRNAALKIADDFLASHPRDAQVRFLRAVILGDLNRPAEAAAVLESLIEDFPELAEPYNNLAAIRANEGNLGLAEHYLQLAIGAAPSYVTARENLGDLYISLAAAAYDGALRLAPENANLRRKLTLTRELDTKLRAPR